MTQPISGMLGNPTLFYNTGNGRESYFSKTSLTCRYKAFASSIKISLFAIQLNHQGKINPRNAIKLIRIRADGGRFIGRRPDCH